MLLTCDLSQAVKSFDIVQRWDELEIRVNYLALCHLVFDSCLKIVCNIQLDKIIFGNTIEQAVIIHIIKCANF